MTDVLIIIPTFDEAENIESVLRGIRRAAPAADVLVVDDNSPDGTAEVVEALGASVGRLEVLRRPAKSGLGSAYRDGFALGLARGYDVLVEMDADSSHDPAALPQLLDAIERGADLAIGSRYVAGGSIPTWSASRRALSRSGNAYASWALGAPAGALTSGYRAFRAAALCDARYDDTAATGYAFQIELAYRVFRAGGRVTEVPIAFHDRTLGESKMSTRITLEALALVSWWGVRDRVARRPQRVPIPAAERALA
jgi:dolichol-phosphate mannosyltransferase